MKEQVGVNALTAAKVGDLETLKHLTLSDNLTDKYGASCLHYAARGGSLSVIEYLIKSCKFSEFQRTKTGATALHDAAARGNTAVVKWFYDNTELKIDDQDGVGVTCLHLAAKYCHFLTVEWLLDEADSDCKIRTASGALPLHFAIVGADLNCVKILVDENPRWINMQMNNGATPVYMACQYGYLSALQFLVSRNGATKIKAYDAMSCLHAAAQMGHLDIVKWLVKEEKMDPNDRDFDGTTPLHYAASRGHPSVVRWLLEEGGARITLDNLGGSPLHTAAEFGEVHCVETLLECGCDINLTDNNGLTADELAVQCQQDQAACLIQGQGQGQEEEEDQGQTEVIQSPHDRQVPLHSPRLSFPPPPSYPPEGEQFSPVSVATAGVNTSFLDFEARSPSPPLPPPPPVYSPPDSTPPSLGSPISPPPPIALDSPSSEVPLSPGAETVISNSSWSSDQFTTDKVDSIASKFGNAEEQNASLVHVVTAEVHSEDIRTQTQHTYERITRSTTQRNNDKSGPYDVVDLFPSKTSSNSIASRPTSFQRNIENNYESLELKSPSILSTSADSIISLQSTDTAASVLSPTSPDLAYEEEHLYDQVRLSSLIRQRDKTTTSGNSSSIREERNNKSSFKPSQRSSVAQFRALFEKCFEDTTSINMADRSSTEIKRSSRSMAVTQPFREVKAPTKNITAANEEHMSNGGGSHMHANGGLASHAAAIANVAARNSPRPGTSPERSASSNGDHAESNGKPSQQSVDDAQNISDASKNSEIGRVVQNGSTVSAAPESSKQQSLQNGSSTSTTVVNRSLSSPPATTVPTKKVNSHDLLADLQSAVSGTSNLTLRKTKGRGEGVSMVFQSGKSKTNGAVSPTTQPASSAGPLMANDDSATGVSDFDPKNFLDKVEKTDSSGRVIPEWRRHVLAKHAAEKAQKEFEERKQVDNYEARFQNMPAWKRALIERREQQPK